jgi:ABC-type tungstate transport system permease subunit
LAWQREKSPAGARYVETRQGIGRHAVVADERGGYTLADRGTYLTQPGRLEVPDIFEP